MAAPLLEASAQEGARLVALRYLAQVADAADRLHQEQARDADAEGSALHDFRVALRRLRSCLRAYEAVLGTDVSKKLRRRLGKIAKRTNPGRDAEVQIEWVGKLIDPGSLQEEPGARWLCGRLQRARAASYGDARADLCERFGRVRSKLEERLSTYTVRHEVGQPAALPPFGVLAAEAAEQQLDALCSDLGQVRSVEDEAIAHRARIHGKRLRYLLEPFRSEVDGAKDAVKELKALQDLLGDLNDLHNLARAAGEALEESALLRARRLREAATDAAGDVAKELEQDERPGLLAILSRTQRDRAALLDALLNEWLAPRGRLERLERAVQELLKRLRGNAASPEHVEIERKYLLRRLPAVCLGREGTEIDQGYLPGEELIERVRRTQGPRGEQLLRTVKLGAGVRRIEVEESCDREVFDTLWSLTQGRRVRKRRYEIEDGDLVWEIDEFKDRELYLAEVELPHEDVAVSLPEWLAPHVVRDVTDEPAYVNANLAR